MCMSQLIDMICKSLKRKATPHMSAFSAQSPAGMNWTTPWLSFAIDSGCQDAIMERTVTGLITSRSYDAVLLVFSGHDLQNSQSL